MNLPTPLDLSNFIYEALDVSNFINVDGWSKFYDEIPVDPYIQDGYRYKSIAWFRIKHSGVQANEGIDKHIGAVNKLSGMDDEQGKKYQSSAEPSWKSGSGYWCWNLPQYTMQQSILYNPVHGDIRREYPRISNNITDSSDFHNLLIHYATYFGWSDAIVLVQFQRIDCLVKRKGVPTVEGFHQDGNQHVGMLIVNRKNITAGSGVSQYVLDDNGKRTQDLIVNKVFEPGQLIYWNDKRVWHYGTDLEVADEHADGGRGLRDIIIMSAKEPPANMPIGPVAEQYRTWENKLS